MLEFRLDHLRVPEKFALGLGAQALRMKIATGSCLTFPLADTNPATCAKYVYVCMYVCLSVRLCTCVSSSVCLYVCM